MVSFDYWICAPTHEWEVGCVSGVYKVCFETLGLPPPREIPFSQCCIKPYSKKNLTDEENLFNCRLSRKRRVTENVIAIWINRIRIF